MASEPRLCGACLANGVRTPAAYVARDATGLEWFECDSHGELDNVAEVRRESRTAIAVWYHRHGLPLPGAS
jgi:hypothetical protein